MTAIKRVSPSQLSKMLKCMRWWYYDYVLHLPTPYKSRFALGKAFHKSVEKNMENKISTNALLEKEEVLSIASDSFDSESLLVEEWVADRGSEKDSCIRVSGGHYDTLAPKIEPVAVEQEWKGTLAGVDAIGYIDIIEPSRIRDTKFKGSTPPSSSTVDFVQRAWYPKAAREVLGKNIVEFVFDCFVALKTKVNYVPIPYTPNEQDEKRIEGELATRLAMAEAGLFPRTNPDLGVCQYCPHATFCWKEDKS